MTFLELFGVILRGLGVAVLLAGAGLVCAKIEESIRGK